MLLLAALALRCDTFGDPNLHGDEAFYATVGLAMHQGALPYVDIWDRKPFGLFALFWLFGGITAQPIGYQIGAMLCAAGTAWAIARMAARLLPGSVPAPLLAGSVYLLWLAPLQGYGGQSPVFYNLFIALAACLALRAAPNLRTGQSPRTAQGAMLLAGIGITIKTTALFEALFIGLFALWQLRAAALPVARMARIAATWALIGALPTLAIALAYGLLGHWAEYWQAMITANLNKPPHWPSSQMRAGIMLLALAPVLLAAGIGWTMLPRPARAFVTGWLIAALLGLMANPNFYIHYAMPILVPLCLAAAGLLKRPLAGLATTAAITLLSISIAPPFRFAHTLASRAAMDRLVQAVQDHGGDGPLLVYDGPSQLYRLADKPLITPLVFPTHLSHAIERDVSHLSTLGETRRALEQRPDAVVMAITPRNQPVNAETQALVRGYIATHCRKVADIAVPERQRTDRIGVWGHCRATYPAP